MQKSNIFARSLLASSLICALLSTAIAAPCLADTVTIDTGAATKPFPHFWEHMFGSGHANLSMRESYRDDLKTVKSITDFKYVRFHDIFHDDNGVYDEDKDGKPIYNFTYVDQIYDGLLKNGVRPYVELGFMPSKLAAKQDIFGFWYKPIISPPKDWNRWAELITTFAQHIVDRYGIDEVSKWYFECWNEPNIGFWGGDPKEQTYYKLYDVTSTALKKVSPKLRIGGPATAQAAWIDRFIEHCATAGSPVDFVSTHVYANDSAEDVFGTHEKIPRRTMVARAVRKVYDQVKASKMPDLPIIWSEFNASYANEQNVTDSPFMGPWLANHIRQSDGLCTEMSYWTFSDVFDEQGVASTPFYGGFGLIATGAIPKLAFNAFKLLHLLGDQRIAVDSDCALATKRADGTIVIAAWNYAEPDEKGEHKSITLKLAGKAPGAVAQVYTIDKDHGSSLAAWKAMGSPSLPSRDQQATLRQSAALPSPSMTKLNDSSELTLELDPHTLSLIVLPNNPAFSF